MAVVFEDGLAGSTKIYNTIQNTNVKLLLSIDNVELSANLSVGLTSGEEVYLYAGLERIKLCDRGEDKRKRLLLLLLIPLLCLPLYSNTSIVTLVIDNVIPGPSPDPGPNPGPNPPPNPT